MMQGKKMPAGRRNPGGLCSRLLHREIVTQLGTFRPCDVLLLWAAVAITWLVMSGVLHAWYLIAKGMI